MYEIEVQHVRLTAGVLPPDVRARFAEARTTLTHIGHTKWEEHCTECAWPDCYKTCDLYNPRNDGNCRRTIDGFAPVPDAPVLGGHVVRVRFKQWANLTTDCHVALQPTSRVQRAERWLNAVSNLATRVPNLGRAIGRPGLLSRIARRLKKRSVAAAPAATEATARPNCFLMEVYNPAERTVELSLDIFAKDRKQQQVPYKQLLRITPGFHRLRIPFAEIEPRLGGSQEASFAINPNILSAAGEGLTLFFGLMTFARDSSFEAAPAEPTSGAAAVQPAAKKVKVVIWDLDHTVWNGILIEDGAGKVALRPSVREVITALDARGIVNSVASKNHEQAALAELDRLGLRDYFVFPRIGWGPKSIAVREIIRSFNVGEDTIAFVDDQPFERDEVRAGNPKVRVYTHEQVGELLSREEFDVPVTDEAKSRRRLYQTEEVRHQALQSLGGDYLEFLRASDIHVRIQVAAVDQLERIHELVQRTNQMNFSGNRYTKPDLLRTISSRDHDSYLIDAEDKYGKYGYIGFAVVRKGDVPRVEDLAFSCRVQSKRVEHAVLVFLMQSSAERGASDFEVFYLATEKNQQVAQVFPDLQFVEASRDGNKFVYRRTVVGALPDTSVIRVTLLADQARRQVGAQDG